MNEPVDETQSGLDHFIRFYNLKRSHHGYRSKGRTPAQALREATGRKKLQPIIVMVDETADEQAA